MGDQRNNPGHRARAFTLIELLVSVAILAAVFGIVASLWGQAGGWNRDIADHAQSLRLQRVVAMMKDQWADRRTGVGLGNSKAQVVTNWRQLSFTTASPILFPEWPLVVATYRIEPETELGRRGEFRVVYEESRVSSSSADSDTLRMNGESWKDGLDPRGRPVRGRTVLLERMPSAAFERFGRDARYDESVQEPKRQDDRAASGSSSDSDKPQESTVPTEKRSGVNADTTDDEDDEGGLKETESARERRRETWRPMDEFGYDGVVPAVRLVGEYDKEKFACVFVILGSR